MLAVLNTSPEAVCKVINLDDTDREPISPLRDDALRAETLEAFARVLSAIRLVEGIASTETSILLSTHKL